MSSATQRGFEVIAFALVILTFTARARAQGQGQGGPGRWVKMAAFPEPSQEIGGTAMDGKIYVFGGLAPDGGGRTPAPKGIVWEYDGASDQWTKKQRMPYPAHHVAIGVVSSKIYVIGGRVGSAFVVASNTDIVEEYDPATDSWGFTKTRMPTPRSGVGFATYGGRIYVAGGEYLDNQMVGVFRDLEAYDPATNQWITLPPLQTPRHGLVGGVIGNRLYMMSGHLQSGGVGGSAADSNANEAFEVNVR